jgi:gliding motility-associated-like protein
MNLKLLLTVFLYCFIATQLPAMHIIGGDFTYECLGDIAPGVKRYRFELTVYRDCLGNGAPFDGQVNIGVHRGSLAASTLVEGFSASGMTQIDIPPDTPTCAKTVPPVCLQRKTYIFTRDLPIITESYFITYQRCCRNNTIANLIDPGDIGATFYIELSPFAQTECNNSPRFSKFPQSVICNNLFLSVDQSATDVDGDLLVYSFCNPLAGGANPNNGGGVGCLATVPDPSCGPPFTNAPFVTPNYTPGAPMGGNPVISINNTTGLITGLPNQLGQFVVTICVQEFRNGALIGTTRREFQFNLADCNIDVLAALSADTLLGPQVYEITSCGEQNLLIKNQSMLGTPPASIMWVFDLKGILDTSYLTDAQVAFPDTGTFRGVLYLNPGDACNDSAEVYVHIFPPIATDFAYTYDTCVAGPVSFKDISVSAGEIIYWDWQFDATSPNSNDNNPDFLFKEPGDQFVTLRVEDKNGCSSALTKTISWQPAPPYLIIKPDRFVQCLPAEIQFTNLSSPIDDSYFIIWDYGDGILDTGIISPLHTYEKAGEFNVALYIQSPIGCEIADTFINLIRTVIPPIADFEYDRTLELNQYQSTVTFTDLSLFAEHLYWQFENQYTTNVLNPTHTFQDTGQAKIFLVVTHIEGCKDTLTRYLDIVPEVRFTMPNAFTPNADSENDDFKGNGWMEYSVGFNMQIWNRWGEKVFESTDYREGWNGTINNKGAVCIDGNYTYTVNFLDTRGNLYEFKGNLNLIR